MSTPTLKLRGFASLLAILFVAGCGQVTDRASHLGAVWRSGQSTPGIAMKAVVFREQPSIVIPIGTYANGYNFVPGNKYVGADRSKTIINFPAQYHFTGDNLSVGSVTFTGNGWHVDKPSGKNDSLKFDNVDWKMSTGDCFVFTSGLSNSAFTNCYFTGPGFGHYGYNYDSLTIEACEYDNVGAGQHIAAFGDSKSLIVRKCWFHSVKGMNSEVQGGADGDILEDNVAENPNLSANFHTNDNSFFYSWPLDASTNTLVQHNVGWSDSEPDGTGIRLGIESGGKLTRILNNLMHLKNVCIGVTDGNGDCSVTAQNNHLESKTNQFTQRANGAASDFQIINSGPNGTTDIDLKARGHWVRNVGWSGGTNVTPQSSSLVVRASVSPTNDADGGASATFTFSNVPAGTPTQIVVNSVASGNDQDARGLFSKTIPYSNPFTLSGQTPGYAETYTFSLLNAANQTLGSCTISNIQYPGSSTIPWPPVTSDINTIRAQLSAAQVQITALQKQVADLAVKNTTLNDAYTALQAKVANFVNSVK